MILNNYELFERETNNLDFLKYVQKVKKKLNLKNFTNFLYTPKNLFDVSEFLEYERYIFTLLKIWAMENESYDSKYIEKLKFLIKKYNLEHRLYGHEKNYINIFEEIIFNSKRNLKNIVVDFNTVKNEIKNEEIFYHFVNVRLTSKKNNLDGEIFITSLRIVLADEAITLSFPFKDITYYKLTPKGIQIQAYKNLYELETKNDDPRVFYVSFERIYYGNQKSKHNK